MRSITGTAKDLHALKQIIKESVLCQRMQFLQSCYAEFLYESESRRVEELKNEGKANDVIFQQAQRRRRGRPTKAEASVRDKYGNVYPVKEICIASDMESFVAVSVITPKQLSAWKHREEKRLRKMSFDALMKMYGSETMIDWDDVASRLMVRTKKLRLGSDCRLTYKHDVDPKVCMYIF